MRTSVGFNDYTVRDILAGRKTQMRFPCDITINGNQPVDHKIALVPHFPKENMYGPCVDFYGDNKPFLEKSSQIDRQLYFIGAAQQPFNIGDEIYVRETIGYGYYAAFGQKTFYKADYPDEKPNFVARWVPAANMPKDEARIFLKISDIGVQRLQDISLEGCKCEGIWDVYKTYNEEYHQLLQKHSYPKLFHAIWDEKWSKKKNGIYSWDNNPWVWVVSFETTNILSSK